MSIDVRNLRRVVTVSGAVATTVQAVTAVVAMRRGRRDYADGVWGPGLAAIAFASAALGNGDAKRRWLLAATTAGWAIRLELLMMDRLRGTDEEDARYTEFLGGDSTVTVLAKVFVTQAIAQVLVSTPIQVAAASPLPRTARRWLFPVGVATMIAGAVVEATADGQKARFTERDRVPRCSTPACGLGPGTPTTSVTPWSGTASGSPRPPRRQQAGPPPLRP